MINEPNGVLLFWNDKWYQIHLHNGEPVIYEISDGVVSIYEKRKYKDKVFDAFIPSFQNQNNSTNE